MPEELAGSEDFPGSPVLGSAVERLVVAGRLAGLFFDFDGVLAAIQDDPDSVRPVAGAREALEALSEVVGRVAVVSSRPAGFLRERLAGVPGLDIHGLYGLEHVDARGGISVEPAARPWLAAVRRLAAEAATALPDVTVEDKRLSVGLHYRLTPHRRPAIEAWASDAQRRTGLLVQAGRMVVELRPPIPMDKGSVVARLAAGLAAAWFFGDDLGDLPAFDELHRRGRDGGFAALAVGVGNDAVVEAVRARADVLLASPAVLVDLLRYLRAQFRP